MWIFSKIFEKKQDSEEINEEEKRPKMRGDKKKALASTALMLMLLVSIYAEPASAGIFDWLKENTKPSWEGVGNFFRTLKNNVLGGFGGALAGAKVGATIGSMVTPGVGTIAGAVIGGVIGYIGGSYVEQHIKDSVSGYFDWFGGEEESSDLTFTFQEPKNVTKEEFESDTPIKNALIENLTDQTDQAAFQDLQILLSKLQSDLVTYDVQPSGDSGELIGEKIKGPESIYGYSAFPVVFEFQPYGNDEVKDPICITSVKLYVKDTNGNKYWERTWTNDEPVCGEEGTLYKYQTILKGPDPYSAYLNNVLSGQASEDLINEIFNAAPEEFEVVAEVHGYRQIYYYNSNTGQWVFDHNEYFDAQYSTLSAYRHIGGGTYVIGGFAGSLPADYKDAPEAAQFTAFQTKVSGASSNLIARLWSAPLHMLNATAAYRFYIQGNPDYFDPFSPTIIDEARIVVYRITSDGHWELAYAIPTSGVTHLGDLSSGKRLDASVNYNAAAGTVSYKAFVAVKAWVTRDDGQQIPIWVLAEPAIAPVDPTITRIVDEYIAPIGDLTSDNVIDAADSEQLKAIADSLITSLNSKVENAQYWVDKGEQAGKDEVVKYAELAIKHYQEAIKYAEKLKTADDPNDVLRYGEIVKEEETIGDYYLRAAQLAYYGQEDQALSLIENAEALEENVAQYKGGLSSFLSNLPSDWSDLSELLPFLLKIALSILAIYIAKQLFGGIGALVALILVGIYWLGPVVGISL